jgi:hypothetical protein
MNGNLSRVHSVLLSENTWEKIGKKTREKTGFGKNIGVAALTSD